jgi:hypothetical protein
VLQSWLFAIFEFAYFKKLKMDCWIITKTLDYTIYIELYWEYWNLNLGWLLSGFFKWRPIYCVYFIYSKDLQRCSKIALKFTHKAILFVVRIDGQWELALSRSKSRMGSERNSSTKRSERGESDAVNQPAEGAAQETNSPPNSSDPFPFFLIYWKGISNPLCVNSSKQCQDFMETFLCLHQRLTRGIFKGLKLIFWLADSLRAIFSLPALPWRLFKKNRHERGVQIYLNFSVVWFKEEIIQWIELCLPCQSFMRQRLIRSYFFSVWRALFPLLQASLYYWIILNEYLSETHAKDY